jgi:hypothetical protein
MRPGCLNAGTPTNGSIVVNGNDASRVMPRVTEWADARRRNESISMQQVETRFPVAWVTEDRGGAKPKLGLVNLPLAPALQGGY